MTMKKMTKNDQKNDQKKWPTNSTPDNMQRLQRIRRHLHSIQLVWKDLSECLGDYDETLKVYALMVKQN